MHTERGPLGEHAYASPLRPRISFFGNLRLVGKLAHDEEPLGSQNDFLDLWDFVPRMHRELSAVCPNLLVLPACERHLFHASAIATFAQEVDLLFRPRLNDLFDALVDGAKHRLVAGQAVGTLTHVPGFCTCSNLAWRWRTTSPLTRGWPGTITKTPASSWRLSYSSSFVDDVAKAVVGIVEAILVQRSVPFDRP